MTGLPFPRVRPEDAHRRLQGTRGLPDQFGRVARDLRVSVTDRCNLRCTYCMPAEGLPWLPKPEMLTDEELVRLVGVFVGLGDPAGPAHRRGAAAAPLASSTWSRGIAALEPRPRIAMTTNGVGLDRLAEPLAAAGLDRVNVSLDTIDADEFAELTRRDRLHDVEAGLKAAAAAGLSRSRSTPSRCAGSTTSSVADAPPVVPRPWLRAALHRADAAGRPARLGCRQHGLGRERSATGSRSASPSPPLPASDRGSAPAERFLVDGGPATVGIIASVSQPFCAACDRTRLTADGQVRNCLFSRTETDLRGPLRAGASDEELVGLLQAEMWRKARGHGIGEPGFVQPDRPMSAIGG